MNLSLKKDLYPLLKLAIPLMLTGIVGASASFFETMFLARVDQQTLAAGALVSWLYATFAVIIFGTLSSINILIALKHGARDQTAISFVVRDGVLLSILLFIPAFLLFWNMAPIFLLFGQQYLSFYWQNLIYMPWHGDCCLIISQLPYLSFSSD